MCQHTGADVNPYSRKGSKTDQVCSPDMVMFCDYLFKLIIPLLIRNTQCLLIENLLK